MMPKFPSFVFIDDVGIQKARQSNVVRSEMEVGPQKTRPKQSKPLYSIRMQVSICAEKEGDFERWYQEQVGSGAYWFQMSDPIRGISRRFRFISDEWEWTKNGNLLTSTFELEAYNEL